MKRFSLLFCALLVLPVYLLAGVTTYTFTSAKWASKVGATVCDGTTDGWISNKDADSYAAGRNDAQGRLYSCGVGVIKSVSGAGATSVLSFDQVRKITFNLCQNSSRGRGTIYVQVGDNEAMNLQINKPAVSGEGIYNRDSVITFETPQSGKIKFWVECSENAIYINSITIRSANGGSSAFTVDTYRLVTDINQLQDSDQVIIGVYKDGVNYIMGYYDEWVSVNNIHAIKGRYAADRSEVAPDESAVYTLRFAEIDGRNAFIFQDELRYEEAYLVASGGQTKNRLAVWTDVVDEKTYGNYGLWDIRIEAGGEAVITNLGNSKAKIIQYNANNNPTLFACYESRSQTPVCLYRRVEAMGDVEAIVAPFVNFGTTIKTQDSRTIQINANRLTEDITAKLVKGEVFKLSATTLDRDGDQLTITYDAPEAGHFIDTLKLRSGSVETSVAVMLQRINPITISQAVRLEDYAAVYLNDVVVTKKYDTYIYVRDQTGSMLLFDRGNGETGKRYGANVKAGDPLMGVTGRFVNYFGVPEISLTEQFRIGQNSEVLPEQAGERIDSADVCRYMLLDSAVVNGWTSLTYKGREYAVSNKFNLPSFIEGTYTRTYVIVSYDRDLLTLYIVRQEDYPNDNPGESAVDDTRLAPKARVIMQDGTMLILTNHGLFTLTGEPLTPRN